jgi:hypothetical protein
MIFLGQQPIILQGWDELNLSSAIAQFTLEGINYVSLVQLCSLPREKIDMVFPVQLHTFQGWDWQDLNNPKGFYFILKKNSKNLHVMLETSQWSVGNIRIYL